jgi:delta 1-pyrroline-5-carboxylate dehydrogenase
VGAPDDLLAYLIRRLLENGANSSFLKSLANGREDLMNKDALAPGPPIVTNTAETTLTESP